MTQEPCTAYDIAKLVREQSAFSIRKYDRRGGNAHSRYYVFSDGSRLTIGRGWLKAFTRAGLCILHGSCRVTAFGTRQS